MSAASISPSTPPSTSQEKIALIGLGYVGLPLALALARKFDHVVGYDISERRVKSLLQAQDNTGETDSAELKETTLKITSDLQAIKDCTFFIVSVPTPIDDRRQPDLSPLQGASEAVAKILKRGDVVVYESTVYPGVTEDYCGEILSRLSGLPRDQFKLGYSPERINPGDREHTIDKVIKIVSGEDEATLDRVATVYGAVVTAGLHRAPSIKVAESAKVIENIQRDLNIALMNELSIIFDRLDIRTKDVLTAAGTKWNFLKFTPGLVGGHCIGVDPYYLTSRAEQVGYHPQVILSGRRINDGMGAFIAQKAIRMMVQADRPLKGARVGILGLTFKENVPDLRNSRVPDIVAELRAFGIDPVIHDPYADPDEAVHEYGLRPVSDLGQCRDLDALLIAVPHHQYLDAGKDALRDLVGAGGVVIDIKSIFDKEDFKDRHYWSL